MACFGYVVVVVVGFCSFQCFGGLVWLRRWGGVRMGYWAKFDSRVEFVFQVGCWMRCGKKLRSRIRYAGIIYIAYEWVLGMACCCTPPRPRHPKCGVTPPCRWGTQPLNAGLCRTYHIHLPKVPESCAAGIASKSRSSLQKSDRSK